MRNRINKKNGNCGILTLDLFIRAWVFSFDARPTFSLLAQLGDIWCNQISWQIDLTWRKLRSVPASGHVSPVQTEQRTPPLPHTRQKISKTTLRAQGFKRVSATAGGQKNLKNKAKWNNFCNNLYQLFNKFEFSITGTVFSTCWAPQKHVVKDHGDGIRTEPVDKSCHTSSYSLHVSGENLYIRHIWMER